MRSIRAPAAGAGGPPVIAFVIRRLLAMVFVMFALSVLVFLIFFATPGVDPASRIAGRNAARETLAAVRHDFGLDRPLPVQYALMMKKLFITRDLTSFVNRGAGGDPAGRRGGAGDALARLRRGDHLGRGGDRHGRVAAAVMRGTFVDPL